MDNVSTTIPLVCPFGGILIGSRSLPVEWLKVSPRKRITPEEVWGVPPEMEYYPLPDCKYRMCGHCNTAGFSKYTMVNPTCLYMLVHGICPEDLDFSSKIPEKKPEKQQCKWCKRNIIHPDRDIPICLDCLIIWLDQSCSQRPDLHTLIKEACLDKRFELLKLGVKNDK